MTDISAASFFRQAAADGGIDFDHEETDTGSSIWPTRIKLKALHPETGEEMGFLDYQVPRRKADKITVHELKTHEDYRRQGVGSALMDEMQRRHPSTPIDHGDRTPAGKAWWKGYTDGKRVQRGRTMASLIDASHPRAEVPPEQAEALEHPSFSEYRRRSLELAKNPTPGTVVWRGETRTGEPHDALRSSGVGMHWTVNPDSVLVPRPQHETERRVLWQGRIENPTEQTIPRSHPSWGGRTGHSMDHEAEVRFQPGSKVHIEGAYVWHGQGDPQGQPVPRRPERTHPGWKWHPVGEHAEVRNLGHIDYGQHETPASDAKMPPLWHGADPHTVLQHEHDAGNHHSSHPGGTYDDIDWDAPDEHVDGHSAAVMTDMALKDGYIKPHELSHEDASEWLRWHPDRAGIEQRHSGKTAMRRTAALQDGDDIPSGLLNPHGHRVKVKVGGQRNVELVPRHEVERYASQETTKEHTKEVGERIIHTGEMEPLILQYHPKSGEAYLGEGNHRLRAARTLQMDHVPVRVTRNNYGLAGPGVKVPQDHPAIAAGEHVPYDIKPSDIGLTTVHKPTMSEADKHTELLNYRLLHGGKTAAYTHDPLPEQVRSWKNTRWDVPHEVTSYIHRGLTLPLTPEDHAYVHDDSIPAGRRAAHIVGLVHAQGGLGRHWTADPDIAGHFSHSGVGELKHHPHLLSVTLHAHPPAPEHIEHDPVELGRMGVQGQSVESEVPLKASSPVRLFGVSWRNSRDFEQRGHYRAAPGAKGITRNASSEKPCPCCGGTGEHSTGFECYHCDGGLTVPVNSSGDATCDGTLPDGGHKRMARELGVYGPPDRWYHASRENLDEDGFEEGHVKPGHDEEYGKHWNSHLGIHLTSHHPTAVELAEGMYGTVHHVSLNSSNPRHYPSEHDLTHDVHSWASKHPDFRRDMPAPDHSLPATEAAETMLRHHPRIAELAQGFRQHLRNQGHDAITYGNEYEGPHGHLCAIALSPHDARIDGAHSWDDDEECGHLDALPPRHASVDTPVPDNTRPYEHPHDWLPRDHFFAPGEKGLDPRLFDGDRMHPEVRQYLLSLLNGFWAPRYGDSWQSWARVYLAGSEASHFYGNGDLDILIGINYEALNQHCDAFCGEPWNEIGDRLTAELKANLNDDLRMLPGPDGKETGPWENTWFVLRDPSGTGDIRNIKPYAAYDITADTWAVRPVEVPDDFGPEKLPEANWDVVDAVRALVKAIGELPPGTREREGAALYDYLHSDRSAAFGDEGTGLYDTANVRWKALSAAPDAPLQQLVDWKHAHGTAATDRETAA
jgi:GNAT superfamily N-acetyltransferase